MKHINLINTPAEIVIQETCKVLQSGGLILFPTETTYGAGVDATNQQAVNKLLKYKSRREGKPLSILVANKDMAKQYVEINEQADKLYKQFLPGPITVVSKSLSIIEPDSTKTSNTQKLNSLDIHSTPFVLSKKSHLRKGLKYTPKLNNPKKYKVANGVTSEFGTLGVRIPDYDLMLKISKNYGKPITATSANASGKKRPYKIDDVFSHLSEKQKSLIDLVLDAGTLPKNDPSTVIDTTLSAPVTLRKSNREEHIQESEKISDQELGNNSSSNDSDRGSNDKTTVNMISTTTIVSRSEQETKDIAGRILLQHWDSINTTGFVIALDGSLGMGKTIFAKGSAKFLGIEDIIKSPTYSYIEEYDFTRHQTKGKLFHLDMWKVEDENMFNRLEINKLIKPNNVLIIEWFSQIESFIKPLLKNVKVVKIKFSEVGESDETGKDNKNSENDKINQSEIVVKNRKLKITEN